MGFGIHPQQAVRAFNICRENNEGLGKAIKEALITFFRGFSVSAVEPDKTLILGKAVPSESLKTPLGGEWKVSQVDPQDPQLAADKRLYSSTNAESSDLTPNGRKDVSADTVYGYRGVSVDTVYDELKEFFLSSEGAQSNKSEDIQKLADKYMEKLRDTRFTHDDVQNLALKLRTDLGLSEDAIKAINEKTGLFLMMRSR